jgi:hypothetical protein
VSQISEKNLQRITLEMKEIKIPSSKALKKAVKKYDDILMLLDNWLTGAYIDWAKADSMPSSEALKEAT